MGMSYALGRFVCVDLTPIAFLEAHEQTACPLISHGYLLLLEVLPNIDKAKKRLYFDFFRSLVNNYLPPKSIILHITSMFYIFRKQRKTEDKEKKRRNCTRKRRWKLLKF